MGTAGRAKSLRALGARKRTNRARIAAGKKPIVGGKHVSASTFAKKTRTTVAKVKKGGKATKSKAKSKAATKRKWGKKAV